MNERLEHERESHLETLRNAARIGITGIEAGRFRTFYSAGAIEGHDLGHEFR